MKALFSFICLFIPLFLISQTPKTIEINVSGGALNDYNSIAQATYTCKVSNEDLRNGCQIKFGQYKQTIVNTETFFDLYLSVTLNPIQTYQYNNGQDIVFSKNIVSGLFGSTQGVFLGFFPSTALSTTQFSSTSGSVTRSTPVWPKDKESACTVTTQVDDNNLPIKTNENEMILEFSFPKYVLSKKVLFNLGNYFYNENYYFRSYEKSGVELYSGPSEGRGT